MRPVRPRRMNSLDDKLGEGEVDEGVVEVLVVEVGEEEVVEGDSRITTSSLQQTLIIYFQLKLLC